MAGMKYQHVIIAIILALVAITTVWGNITLGGLLAGGALPADLKMEIFMIGLILVGGYLIYYSITNVVSKYGGAAGEGFTYFTAGIILFVAVTVLDLTVHRLDISKFNYATHFMWHFAEFFAIIYFFLAAKKLAELAK